MVQSYSSLSKTISSFGCEVITPKEGFVFGTSRLQFKCSAGHVSSYKATSLSNRIALCKKINKPLCNSCSKEIVYDPLIQKIKEACKIHGYEYIGYDITNREVTFKCNCGNIDTTSKDNILKETRTPTCISCRNKRNIIQSELKIELVDEGEEEWSPVHIPGKPELGEKYSVSTNGELRYTDTWKKVPFHEKDGYLFCTLIGETKIFTSVHRIVAFAFLDKPKSGQTQVNHKNGMKKDNRLENLEWCSSSENISHAHSSGLHSGSGQRVDQFTLKGEFVARFESIRDASRKLNIDGSSISKVCRGKYKKAGGYTWSYVREKQHVLEIDIVNLFSIPGMNKDYKITRDGKVYSMKTGEKMSTQLRDGYERIRLLTIKGERKAFSIHCLVAETFLSDSKWRGTLVDHLNGDKSDNRVDNLQWVSSSVNICRGIRGTINSSNIVVETKEGKKRIFKSLEEAQNGTLIDRDTIIDTIYLEKSYKGIKITSVPHKVKVSYKDGSFKIYESLMKASNRTEVSISEIWNLSRSREEKNNLTFEVK